MSPEAAGELLPADEAVGAVIKKCGLKDTLLDAAKHIPGAEKIIQEVDERLTAMLHKLGMDIHGKNLTREQQNELVELTEKLNGFTDEEMGKLTQAALGSDTTLTLRGNNDTVNNKLTEGIVQRVAAKGYDETQIRNAVRELEAYQLNPEQIADHIVERIIDRNVTAEGIDDAIRNPLKTLPVKYDKLGRPSYNVVGKNVTVAINPDTGRLITVHPTHTKKAAELMKENKT